MKRSGILKKLAPVLFSAAMLFGMSSLAFGATAEIIDDVSVDIQYELANGMTKSDIDVNCDTDGVESATVTSITNVAYGKKPKVTIKLKREDSDYKFSGLNKSSVNLTGDDATLSSVKCTSSAATIVVTLPKIGSTSETALEVTDVTWSDDEDGVVEWSQADDADSYEVKFMRGNSVKSTINTTKLKYDFRSLIRSNGTGTYRVKVKAIAGSYKGEWTESDDFDVDDDVLDELGGKSSDNGSSNSNYSNNSSSSGNASTTGSWLKDNYGTWYCNADRSYTTNNWQQIDGFWYFFNESGYVKTGWYQSAASGKWYYLSQEANKLGRMLTSQWVDNGKYYVDANGVWNGQTK